MTDPKDKKARIIPTPILELSEDELEDLLQPWVAGATAVGVLAALLVPWRCESVGSMIMRRLEMKQNNISAPKVEVSDTGASDAGVYDAGAPDAGYTPICPDGESCFPSDSIICREGEKCYSENAVLCKDGEQCYDPVYVTDLENKLKTCLEDLGKKQECKPTYIPIKCPPVAECPALPLMRTDNYNDTIMR
ncbi:hypothetical protein HYV87_02740 [Candidatus Woesearchaeota archaeon]|nr:hypothetical protein [Candidatus Woesearchaeota archaeon]